MNQYTRRRQRTKVSDYVLYSESPWFESRPRILLTNFLTSPFPSSQILEQCNDIHPNWHIVADTCVWQSVVRWTDYNSKTLRHNVYSATCLNMVTTNTHNELPRHQMTFMKLNPRTRYALVDQKSIKFSSKLSLRTPKQLTTESYNERIPKQLTTESYNERNPK